MPQIARDSRSAGIGRRPPAARPIGSAAVVGAGIAGLACARELARASLRVLVVEKARSAGGRVATRRAPPFAFDHGAQYFTTRGVPFRRQLASWLETGSAAPWRGRFARGPGDGGHAEIDTSERYVGTPGMSALARDLGRGLDLRVQTRIEAIEAVAGRGWRLRTSDGETLGPFDAVAVAVPAPQAVPLLQAAPALAARAAKAGLAPCIAALAAFARPIGGTVDGWFLDGPVLSWAARDASKPGRPREECWVFHARPDWSRHHLEQPIDALGPVLCHAFSEALGSSLPPLLHLAVHRWRYALPEAMLSSPCLWDPELRLGACGDWCLGARLEAAFESGQALAAALLGRVATGEASG